MEDPNIAEINCNIEWESENSKDLSKHDSHRLFAYDINNNNDNEWMNNIT